MSKRRKKGKAVEDEAKGENTKLSLPPSPLLTADSKLFTIEGKKGKGEEICALLSWRLHSPVLRLRRRRRKNQEFSPPLPPPPTLSAMTRVCAGGEEQKR